ncbi:type I restriction enzyme HsdR N-terminal domain-containing protein [Sulfitobacter sp. LCG007]
MNDFIIQVEGLAARAKAAERQALTEEATKTSVVMPVIQALGFDVFNLEEVIPEFIADVGVKKGEKVDFAIKIDGRIAMLIEVKPISSTLGDAQFSQLFRYFHVTEARLAILTNGREMWFFSDTDSPNVMDKRPFFKFDFKKYDRAHVEELARFRKGSFAIDSIIEAASNLKYTRSAANYLKKQMETPEEDFVRLIGKHIHEGMLTKAVLEQLKPSIQAALDELVRDRIQDKLSITFRSDAGVQGAQTPDPTSVNENDIATTDEEREGYMIVRAIAARIVPVDRITIRDAKSYCAVLMDDNNRKPICRLYFNSPTTKNLGIFDGEKNETRMKVEAPSDLYRYADAIEAVVKSYAH